MAIHDLYHYRKKLAEQDDMPDVWEYLSLPDTLRKQLCIILERAIGNYNDLYPDSDSVSNKFWSVITSELELDLGVKPLMDRPVGVTRWGANKQLLNFVVHLM